MCGSLLQFFSSSASQEHVLLANQNKHQKQFEQRTKKGTSKKFQYDQQHIHQSQTKTTVLQNMGSSRPVQIANGITADKVYLSCDSFMAQITATSRWMKMLFKLDQRLCPITGTKGWYKGSPPNVKTSNWFFSSPSSSQSLFGNFCPQMDKAFL